MPTLREKQSQFVRMVGQLIEFATSQGYELTYGDAYSQPHFHAHSPHSLHYLRLAVDFNLFKNGEFLQTTEDHLPLGQFWESIGGTWGGRFEKPDGNHYSLEHNGRR